MSEMIVYEFVFTDEDGSKVKKDIWADYETQAWNMAQEYAFERGYVDFEMVD